MFEAMSRVLLSKKYGAKLEGKVELREEKCLLESSEKSLNVVRNDAIEGEKEHDSKAEVISLRREKGRYIENRRRIGLTMGSTFFRGKVGYRCWAEHMGGNVWKLPFDCFYFPWKHVAITSIMSKDRKLGVEGLRKKELSEK